MIGASVREVAASLGLNRAGREWRGNCPCCGYKAAFILMERRGRVVGWCASCQNRNGIREFLSGRGGSRKRPDPAAAARSEAELLQKRRQAQERALALWRGSEPITGTAAEVYLRARGVGHIVANEALRFRCDCPHPTGTRQPALIGLVTGVTHNAVAIHRTYLRRDGSAKADVEPQKATLGSSWGGAVRLDPAAPELAVGEGVETAASAGRILCLPAWAALSAGNLAMGLLLPPEVRAVVVAVDRDNSGVEAAYAARDRWQTEGRSVRLAYPTAPHNDFNDVLLVRQKCRR